MGLTFAWRQPDAAGEFAYFRAIHARKPLARRSRNQLTVFIFINI